MSSAGQFYAYGTASAQPNPILQVAGLIRELFSVLRRIVSQVLSLLGIVAWWCVVDVGLGPAARQEL
jgi:hypothetical protein